MVMWLFFSQLPKGDSIRSAETAVVILLLKFSWYFMTIIIIFVQEPPFLHRCSAKTHFAILQVLFLFLIVLFV